jgi:hypothetical protein
MRIFQHLPHEAVMGRTREDIGLVNLPPRPPEPKEVIESKLIPCERCGTDFVSCRIVESSSSIEGCEKSCESFGTFVGV